jgi:hypothetical protein
MIDAAFAGAIIGDEEVVKSRDAGMAGGVNEGPEPGDVGEAPGALGSGLKPRPNTKHLLHLP